MKANKTRDKLPPLHLACSTDELRTEMMCVFIDEGVATATNGHILVRYNLSDYLEQADLNKLNGKLIPASFWKIMSQTELWCIKIHEDRIEARMKGNYHAVLKFSEHNYERYLDFKGVIADLFEGRLTEAKPSIKLNVKLLSEMTKILSHHYNLLSGTVHNQVRLFFNEGNRAIIVANEANEDAVGIIMPVMVDVTFADDMFARFTKLKSNYTPPPKQYGERTTIA